MLELKACHYKFVVTGHLPPAMILPPMGRRNNSLCPNPAPASKILALEDSLDEIAEVKPLRGACEGLTEIIIDFRVATTKVCIRILGFAGPARDEFTLLTDLKREKTTRPMVFTASRPLNVSME